MARKPNFITFTGVDARTSITDMQALDEQYPIEWGVLFSASQQGTSNRFPPTGLLHVIPDKVPRCAAHLCGRYARAIMNGQFPTPPEGSLIRNWRSSFTRVQVNHHDGKFSLPNVLKNADLFGDIICHFRPPEAFPDDPRVSWLFDASFGAGIEPERWPPHPNDGRLVGYAGGIGPDNIERIIETINSPGPYWIDMEQNVRTDDWLDLAKCRRVCEAVYGRAA